MWLLHATRDQTLLDRLHAMGIAAAWIEIQRPRFASGISFPADDAARAFPILGIDAMEIVLIPTDRQGVELIQKKETLTNDALIHEAIVEQRRGQAGQQEEKVRVDKVNVDEEKARQEVARRQHLTLIVAGVLTVLMLFTIIRIFASKGSNEQQKQPGQKQSQQDQDNQEKKDYTCPGCKYRFNRGEASVEKNPITDREMVTCPNCKITFTP